jgi:methylmalonyl-CoA mutase, N-terminal domain
MGAPGDTVEGGHAAVVREPGMETEEHERWLEHYRRTPERDADFETLSGEPLKPLYTPQDVQDLDYDAALGYPGHYPFTRGVYHSMYRGRLWTMRQFAGFGTPEETNRRYKFLLRQGQGGLSVAFDMPTLMGRDSDDPRSEGEVGRCGVATDSLEDFEILFDGIPLGDISTSMTISGPATIVFAFFLAAAERQGVPWKVLDGTLQTDILKEYIAQKEWIFPPRPHLRLIGDLIEFCAAEAPKFHPISVSGYHIREAGSTAAQELAFTLADGFAYVELGRQRGLDVDAFSQGLSFFFNAHIDFFEEIAKYRAARRIWARWLKERYGATSEQAMRLRFHTQTAGCSLTAQQPENNIVRTAIEALAAVLGGTQSLHTNALDEVLALPTEKAAEIALRTQQIVAHETGVANVIDPLGGSYFVEALTDRMERLAEDYFARIDEMGRGSILEGMLAGIERGYFQSEIADAAFREQELYEKGRLVKVGVNEFVNPDESPIDTLVIGPEAERSQLRRVSDLRAGRDGSKARAALDRLTAAAATDENLIPLLVDCARAYCTEGEIVTALRGVFGEYTEDPRF